MTALLDLKNIVVEFTTDRGVIRALDNVSFSLERGETLGVVGESGCGKSVTALTIMQLIPDPPGKCVNGQVMFNDRNLLSLSEREMRKVRGREVSMIFQEPMTALNPVFTIGNQLIGVIRDHQKVNKKEARQRAIEMLKKIHIPIPEKRMTEYPHQLSGGMRQRVMIAMALSCQPSLLIADEPTTALDVTVQAQVMAEIQELQEQLKTSMILITHDMGVVAESCQKVVVMYCGKIVEQADVKTLFKSPKHPYTRGLMESIPQIRKERLEVLPTIKGIVPDLLHLPKGCRYADRCPKVEERCHAELPALTQQPDGSWASCFFPNS